MWHIRGYYWVGVYIVPVRLGWEIFLNNPKVWVCWIGNPTQQKKFHNPTQLNPLFSSWVWVVPNWEETRSGETTYRRVEKSNEKHREETKRNTKWRSPIKNTERRSLTEMEWKSERRDNQQRRQQGRVEKWELRRESDREIKRWLASDVDVRYETRTTSTEKTNAVRWERWRWKAKRQWDR